MEIRLFNIDDKVKLKSSGQIVTVNHWDEDQIHSSKVEVWYVVKWPRDESGSIKRAIVRQNELQPYL